MRPTSIISVFLTAILLCSNCSSDTSKEIRVGKSVFRIPINLLDEDIPGISSLEGADPYGPVLIEWESSQVKGAIPEFVDDIEGIDYPLSILIYARSIRNVGPYLQPYLLTGSYENGTFEFDEMAKLYKVANTKNYYSWALLAVAPNSQVTIPSSIGDFWIGKCRRPVLKNHGVCTIEFIYRSHRIEYRIADKNLKLRDEISKFITNKLDSFLVAN